MDYADRFGAFFPTVTAALPPCWWPCSALASLPVVYLPFVVLSNKARTVIEQEEGEEDIANALKF